MADTDRDARERFAANIERLRRRDGSSVEQLAARAAMDGAELAEILAAEREADYGTIVALAGVFDVEPGDLFEGIDWIPGDGDRPGGFKVDGPGD
ncbi:MAG: helix-turn-helix transcriptional regulator [Actinobacteria bacterium]|nr:helix-turn-helix transcriptional regulator [Actinomycetota bacterium]